MSFRRFRRRLLRSIPPLPGVPSFRQIQYTFRHLIPPPPQVPSLRKTWYWIRARPSRRKNILRLALILLAAVALRFVGPPISHLIKDWQARRLASQAAPLIEKEDWSGAGRKIQSAFRLSFTETDVWRVQARLLSRIGRGTEAVNWWQKIALLDPLSIADRRDYAAAALAARDLTIATEQINYLFKSEPNPIPQDYYLAATLDMLRGFTKDALNYGGRVLSDERAGSREKVGASSLIVTISAPDSELYRQAYEQLIKAARDNSNQASLQALTILARQVAPPKPGKSSLAPPEAMTSMEIADRLDQHPRARPLHRLIAAELHSQNDKAGSRDSIDKAVKAFGNGDDETLTTLAAWLYTRKEFATVLQVLPEQRAVRTRELFVQRVDALGALGRYDELKEMLSSEQSVLDPATQHMFLAVVNAKLGESVASANEWDRALEESDNLQKLFMLADFAEKNGALEIADGAYERAIKKQPGLRSAYNARMRLAEALGETSSAHDIAKEIIQLWPDDTATRVHEIYLRLLLDPSSAEGANAENEVAPIASSNPWDTAAHNALALARLRQGRMAAALEAAPQPGPGIPPSPTLAIAWARNGWKDKAKEEMRKLSTAKLLPEERQLIAPLTQL